MKKIITACILMIMNLSLVGCENMSNTAMNSNLSQSLTMADRAKMSRAFENNAIGQAAYWQNPKTGTHYHLTPLHNVSVLHNRYCREYRFVTSVKGKKQQVYGTACRQVNGSWRIIHR